MGQFEYRTMTVHDQVRWRFASIPVRSARLLGCRYATSARRNICDGQVGIRQDTQRCRALPAWHSTFGDPTDAAAVNAIARITGGNFRLVERIFAQIQRVVQINDLSSVTPEVVTAAGESLVIGPL
jgi:hypothetical protein